MTRRTYDSNDLRAMAADGLSLSEMAAETDSTVDNVRAALRRRGLKAVREVEQSLRAKVAQMKPLDAVDFLLLCVENLAPALCGAEHPVDRLVDRATPLERRLLIVLSDAAGGVVPRAAMLNALYFDLRGDDIPHDKIIDVLICKVRPKLKPGLARIVTHWGHGWSLEVVG